MPLGAGAYIWVGDNVAALEQREDGTQM